MAKRLKIPPVRFFLKDNSEYETLIYLAYRYIPNGKRLVWSTGEKVDPKYWDKKSRRARYSKKHPDYPELNRRLDELAYLTQAIFKEYDFGEISIDNFKTELDLRTGKVERETDEVVDLVSFAKAFVSERENDPNAKAGTTKVLRTVSNLLREFKAEIPFAEVDYNFREAFKLFLFNEKKHSINYAAKVFEVFRQFMREAMRRDLHKNRKFEDFTIEKVKVRYPILTQHEITLLEKLDLSDNKRLDKARSLFLIGIYSGQRFSDFVRFKPNNFFKDEDGDLFIHITRQVKTGKTDVIIPVLPMVLPIFEKYEFYSPKLANQKLNEYIKEVCELAGIDTLFETIETSGGKVKDAEPVPKWQKITSHSCRRTFVSLAKYWGISESMIQAITGHATAKQLNEYDHTDKVAKAKEFARQFKVNFDRRGLRVVNE